MELVNGGSEIDIVLPVYGEPKALSHTARKLGGHLAAETDAPWQITIPDNPSTDGTQAVVWPRRDPGAVSYAAAPALLTWTAPNDECGTFRTAASSALHRTPLATVHAPRGSLRLLPSQTPSFLEHALESSTVGIASTIAYAMLYLMLQPAFGALSTSFGSLLITATRNTAVNHRSTFSVRVRHRGALHPVQGLIVFGHGWGPASSSLHVPSRPMIEPGVTTRIRLGLPNRWLLGNRLAAQGGVRRNTLGIRARGAA